MVELSRDDASTLRFPQRDEDIEQVSTDEYAFVDRVLNNIDALCKKNDVKTGELESKAGVSQGYLSRVKQKKIQKLPIAMLAHMAEYLNVSLDLLINGEIEHLNKKEQTVINFCNKLYTDTYDNKINWESYRCKNEDIAPLDTIDDITIEMTEHMDSAERLQAWGMFNTNIQYKAVPSGSAYNAYLSNLESSVTLFKVRYKLTENKDADKIEWSNDAVEIYVSDKNSGNNYVCSTRELDEEVAKSVNKLYKLLSEEKSKIQLNDASKSIIENIINN